MGFCIWFLFKSVIYYSFGRKSIFYMLFTKKHGNLFNDVKSIAHIMIFLKKPLKKGLKFQNFKKKATKLKKIAEKC